MKLTIAGHAFELAAPYAAGHVLNEAEAASLNQTRAENVGNQLRKHIKALQGDAETLTDEQAEQIRALVAERDASYTFGIRAATGATRTTDPVEREARVVAREQIVAHLAKSNRKIKDLDKELVATKIAELAANPKVVAEAKKRIKARSSDLGDLFADEGEAVEAA